ncbi:MAG: ABC transporter permease [Methanobrevibacter sp.]|uniref:ABC transporter permease n=1 Tax=Methanobrevibacter sp. TaxID=66852 RepID=UPI0025F91000|nr:ABC transporter permease [Methanobrevibacter sp.]MBE6497298.1 ABC transporter permease [Methanobrevibacter sp.]
MNFIKRNDLFLLEEIVRKNFFSRYKDSVLGVFWTVLKPLLMTILFTIIFSTVFGRSIDNFPLYFLSGRCIFDFFNGSINVAMGSIKGNKNILQRNPAPKYIFILGGIISEFFTFIINLILLIGVIIVTHAQFYLIMPLSIIPIISLVIMIIGLGLMLSIICVYYTDVQHLWGVLSVMIMYSSALFYPMDIIPEPFHQYMILNPLYWIVDQFRSFIYVGAIPDVLNMVNSLLLSVIILIFGIIIFKKYEKKVSMRF